MQTGMHLITKTDMKYFLIVLTLLFFIPLHAVEPELLELLQKKQASIKTEQIAIQAGNERALLCKYCHGADGNSKKDTIPNLAAQNPEYLLRQFELFASRERINKTMNELAKILTPEDRVNIALFFSSQLIKPQQPYKPELAETGEKLFNTKCFFCHGKNAHGKKELPRIASQPSKYIIRTLQNYQSPRAKRIKSAMSRIAKTLNENEIEALTAYLTSIN